MPDNDQTAKSKNTWAQKGLGWLPDYPDLRDYQLNKEEIQKGGRLNLEETTSSMEGLANSVISVLKLLQERCKLPQERSGESSPAGEDPFKPLIDDLQSKVFGNISFLDVKFRKILRPVPKSLENLSLSLSSSLYYQDDLWKQSLHEIKNYLYLYFIAKKHQDANTTAGTTSGAEGAGQQTDIEFYQRVVKSIKDCSTRIENSTDLREEQKRATQTRIQALITDIEGEALKYNIERLGTIQGAIAWMKSTEFDEVTIALVRVFQKCNEVEPTGVIGPLTYNVFSKALRKPVQCKKTSVELPLLKSVPSVQLIFIPSLFPSEAIEAVFEELIKICTEEVKKSKRTITEIDIFKKEFLVNRRSEYGSFYEDGINTASFKKVDEFLLSISYPSESTGYGEIREWLLRNRLFLFTLVPENKRGVASGNSGAKLLLEMSYKIINNEFKVIEPIVSVILKLVMPLASGKYRNWSEAISEGVRRLEKLTEKSTQPSLPREAEDEEFLRLLVAEALQKNDQEVKEGLTLVIDEVNNLLSDKQILEEAENRIEEEYQSIPSFCIKEKEEKREKIKALNKRLDLIKARCEDKERALGATLYFYFLIEQFVIYHSRKLKANYSSFLAKYKIDFSTTTPAAKGNFFDKREVFEIENSERFYRSNFLLDTQKNEDKKQQEEDGNEQTRHLELFPTEILQMPVLISLPRLLGLNHLDAQTSAYFFLPGVVDLSYWCTPIEDQGGLQSCAAMAGVALMEYFVNRSQGKYTDLSPLFLYKVARGQLNLTGDVGASLRETMKAMALHGVPPESVWEYDPAKVNEEPPPFCYSYAQNYQALKYFRLDYAGISLEALLFQIKAVLSAGFPCMFGFTIYTSAYEDTSANQGWIPFPDAKRDKVRGGHAVVAVGYDDYQLIPRADRNGHTLGAFLIRNCWGKEWGKEGYGWLPYDYVRQGLTYDWWSLLKAEWFEADLLGAGASNLTGPKWPLQASLDGAFWISGPGQTG